MKVFLLQVVIVLVAIESAYALDLRPKSIPAIDWNCYQAFTTGSAYPEDPHFDIAVDGDNFDTPHVRYRLLTVDGNVLKLIADPNRSQFRTEKGISIYHMTRDFTNKHRIVGWRELEAGNATQYTLDFDNRILSILRLPSRTSLIRLVIVDVLKCSPAR